MGRVGADFTALLPAIFEPRLVDIVVSHWTDGARTLDESLRVCREAGIAAPLHASSPTDDAPTDATDDATPDPPRRLLAYPPMARFVNAYLTGLNELRRCLLPGSFPALRHACRIRLLDVVRASLRDNERWVETPGLRGEATELRRVAKQMRIEFDRTVAPYVLHTLEIAFGTLDRPLPPLPPTPTPPTPDTAEEDPTEIQDDAQKDAALAEEEEKTSEIPDDAQKDAEEDEKEEEDDVEEQKTTDEEVEIDPVIAETKETTP